MFNLFLTGDDSGSSAFFYVILIVVVLGMLVFPIFSGKKREEQMRNMLGGIKPGDKIKTIGGIVGNVVEVKNISELETYILIETGEGDVKSTLWFDIKAVGFIMAKSVTAEDGEVFEDQENELDGEATGVENEVETETADEVEAEAEVEVAKTEKKKTASRKDDFDNFDEFND